MVCIMNMICHGINYRYLVSAQPMNDNETKMGALNRSEAAYAEFLEKYDSPPAYSIGMEGGVQLSGDDLECFAWMAIFDGFRHGTARTASFPLPKKVRDLVLGGMELGHADDAVFGRSNSKQKNGAVGLLTKDVIDREMYYEHAVILAMIPFQWENLYFEEQE